VILIKPTIDASDKEIFKRNGYSTASKNIVDFLESGNREKFIANVFKPKYLGDFTNNSLGITKNITSHNQKADFNNPGKNTNIKNSSKIFSYSQD
jgi:hypothetical protein